MTIYVFLISGTDDLVVVFDVGLGCRVGYGFG